MFLLQKCRVLVTQILYSYYKRRYIDNAEVTRMFPDFINHYRVRNLEGEVRPKTHISEKFQDPGFDEDMLVLRYYKDWRRGEEFDKANTGMDNYKAAPLKDVYDSYYKQWYGALHFIRSGGDEVRASKLRETGTRSLMSFRQFEQVLAEENFLYLYGPLPEVPRSSPVGYRDMNMITFPQKPDCGEVKCHRRESYFLSPPSNPVMRLKDHRENLHADLTDSVLGIINS
jgi:hypothetical protein